MSTTTDPMYQLMSHFRHKIKYLQQLAMMRFGSSSDSADLKHELVAIDQSLTELETALAHIKATMAAEQRGVDTGRVLVAAFEAQSQQLKHIQAHLPRHLPGRQAAPVHKEPAKPTASQSETKQAPSRPTTAATTSASTAAATTATAPKKKTVTIPNISYVTTAEFASLPKYMVGRLTQDKINSAIEEIQAIVKEKYKILAMNPQKMKEPTLKLYKAYKDDETKETAGTCFFVERDLKDGVHVKLDATGKSLLSVLRQLGRLKTTGGAAMRYILCREQA